MAVDLSFFRSETSQRLRAEGKAEAILEVLTQRRIAVPAEAHDRIAACTDHDQLTTWLTRAITIETIADLFV